MSVADTAVIVLSYRRPQRVKTILNMLTAQTNKEFTLYISNSSTEQKDIDHINMQVAAIRSKNANVSAVHTKDNDGCWRRHTLARRLALSGVKKILFLDDDVNVPSNYIELALAQYEDRSYKSWWAWDLRGGYHYEKDRVRATSKNDKVDYCGAGVSIVDASLFLDNKYFDVPPEAKWIDDIWMSYYTKSVLGWKLCLLEIDDVSFDNTAADEHALYQNIRKEANVSKHEFVEYLKSNYDWKL